MTPRGRNVAKALKKRQLNGLHVGRPRKPRPLREIKRLRKLGMSIREIAIALKTTIYLVWSVLPKEE